MTTLTTARIPLALAMVVSCCATLTALSAATDEFNIRPGLWELTTSFDMKGDPQSMMSAADRAQMEEAMTHMTPEQRAKMEAMMKQQSAGPWGTSAKPLIKMACFTKENIHKEFSRLGAQGEGSTCKTTTIKHTSTLFEGREVCGGGNNSNAILQFEASNPERLTGTVNVVPAEGRGGFEGKFNLTGRWLGSSCGDVKP